MQPISPFLWFDTQAEDAAQFYVSIFPNSRILSTSYYSEGAPYPVGTVMVVQFELNGVLFQALNGGPHFQFSPAVSFAISARDQAEIDHYWNALSGDGGTPGQCGWLDDKFGLSWQVIPAQLGEILSDPDPEKAGRATGALMGMTKIVIAELEAARDGTAA
ncbi:VOC family protein [Klugiella xanthotipulae]|uniref:Putative 3-demethylubiquinone-9 3-methyltransferase (Glyoxalase superfamily) n=1 Tax=Klugiella xanthotipulae TaxID=244735 RepID=A0A543I6Z3_9MICO|nr:VOC family protein [Klugiella xanthotipulae]TQM66373.1 putative 3-demethylubiquinone-9 3-methyltransferase (glyoxalase superfamily) [Klugiella xanthotipulae]